MGQDFQILTDENYYGNTVKTNFFQKLIYYIYPELILYSRCFIISEVHRHCWLLYYMRVKYNVSICCTKVYSLVVFFSLFCSIKMEVGIEDCLHIEFEYNKSKYVLILTITFHFTNTFLPLILIIYT